jgi:putative flippase GtrA
VQALAKVVRFGMVGGLATLTHGGIAVLASRVLLMPPLVANATGFLTAFLVSFLGHTFFTFRSHMEVARALRFATVAVSSVLISSGLVLAASHWTPLPPGVSLPAVALCTPAFNFACHSLWTFRQARRMVG